MSSEGLRFTLSVDGIVEMATAVVSFRLYQHHCTPFILEVEIASGLFRPDGGGFSGEEDGADGLAG